MIKNYKHIIWDWNGTLLNDVDYCCKIINKILVKNFLPELSLEKYRQIFTFPVQDYYKGAGLDFTKTSFEILGKDFIDQYEANKLSCSLFENAIEILSAIHKKGIGQSVLSAYLHDNLVKILDHYKLTKYFDNIIGLDNIYAGSKTHLGLSLVEQLNMPKNEILFIGDTLHDAEVAEAMSVNSILISNGHQTKNKLLINNNIVMDNLNQLQEFFDL
ncbi:MAG TPA: HAD family hydrolase [Ignavibacteriaceae bacterium]